MTRAALDPPVLRSGQQGGEAAVQGVADGGAQVEEDAREGADGDGPGVSQGNGRKPRVQMLRELLQREGWY